MKKIRSIVNVALGTMIAGLGLSSCDTHMVAYGDPFVGDEIDTTVHCMYGVNPNPIINWDNQTEETND